MVINNKTSIGKIFYNIHLKTTAFLYFSILSPFKLKYFTNFANPFCIKFSRLDTQSAFQGILKCVIFMEVLRRNPLLQKWSLKNHLAISPLKNSRTFELIQMITALIQPGLVIFISLHTWRRWLKTESFKMHIIKYCFLRSIFIYSQTEVSFWTALCLEETSSIFVQFYIWILNRDDFELHFFLITSHCSSELNSKNCTLLRKS